MGTSLASGVGPYQTRGKSPRAKLSFAEGLDRVDERSMELRLASIAPTPDLDRQHVAHAQDRTLSRVTRTLATRSVSRELD